MATIKKGKSNKKINFEDIDLDDSLQPVSYTHLDVYKRQGIYFDITKYTPTNSALLHLFSIT